MSDEPIRTIKFELLFEIRRSGEYYEAWCSGNGGIGHTKDEALNHGKENTERWLSDMLKHGLPIQIGKGARESGASKLNKIKANFSERASIIVEISLDGQV